MEPSDCTSPEDYHDEALDPRVQVELENLNTATDEINRLEAMLEDANNAFRLILNETSAHLQSLSKKLGSCIEKARPYYEKKETAKKLQVDCQRAAVQYQRANGIHQAARETISLAEERFANLLMKEKEEGQEKKFDSAWQEMLNHATMKIMEAEAQKSASGREHQRRAIAYTEAEKEVHQLERKLKTAIAKSRSYFDYRSSTEVRLQARKDWIYKLQKDINVAKNKYRFTLQNLEQISEEIHELRRLKMKREPGVGAEKDECLAFIERVPSQDSLLDSAAVNEEQSKYWNNMKLKLDEMERSSSRISEVSVKTGKNSIEIMEHNFVIEGVEAGKMDENEGLGKEICVEDNQDVTEEICKLSCECLDQSTSVNLNEQVKKSIESNEKVDELIPNIGSVGELVCCVEIVEKPIHEKEKLDETIRNAELPEKSILYEEKVRESVQCDEKEEKSIEFEEKLEKANKLNQSEESELPEVDCQVRSSIEPVHSQHHCDNL